jgi:rifampicin phosphotransferase
MNASSSVPKVDRWIRENEYDPRLQFWTRANVSEVLPEPVTPLGFDLIWEHVCIDGWRDLFVQDLGMGDDEVDRERAEVVGVFGGYAYLGAALFRVWAGRTPGMTPTTIDDAYFGDHPDVPPYVAEPWHTNAHTTEVMGQYLVWATTGLDQSRLNADKAESLQLRANRPDFASMSIEALLGFCVAQRPLMRRIFHTHINQSLAASVGPGILNSICTAIGQPQYAMRLMSGMGGVDSAAPSYAMWELSRRARASASLTAIFEGGNSGVHARLVKSAVSDADAKSFLASLNEFLAEFGSRGSNEWDLVAEVWELRPDTVLAAIDRMRVATDDVSPLLENAKRETERHELAAQIRTALAGNEEALGGLEVGLASSSTFMPGRERSKTTNIRVLHEIRMAALEIGRRLVANNQLNNVGDVFYLFADELEQMVHGNASEVKALIPNRIAYREWLATIEPPFIIKGVPTPNTEWVKRGSRPVALVAVGDVIQGVPGCPGTATGRARVITDPTDPFALEPGDILIAPATDPSWTPLFVPAAAVVVDVGAALSHAVIVSRELGIPCVPSALDATRRIPDGAIITVNGDNATVTIVSLPN